jgi:NAD+ diphosphatase
LPTFTGMALDRATAQRTDPTWVAKQLQDPSSQAIAADSSGVLLDHASPRRLIRRAVPSGSGCKPAALPPLLLGLDNGKAVFGVDLDALTPAARSDFTAAGRLCGLRGAAAAMAHDEAGLAAYLTALLNWHRRHPFCPACGAETVVLEAGYSRRCMRCRTMHFPRTDPVVIVLVENDRHVLLGRHSHWPQGQYSVIAGFVSPGESLQEAVAREVEEETAITVRNPLFVTSQPWPFPISLMIGFEARADGGTPDPRDGELEDVRWFDLLEAVRLAATDESEELRLAPRFSIGRLLIERWIRRTL